MLDEMKFRHREQWGEFLNSLGLTGNGVEVGTYHAELACAILEHWQGHLTCIDPWANPPGYHDDPAGDGDREADYQIALTKLSQFCDKATAMRKTSAEAAPCFPNGSLDFAYIDGNHRSPFVDQDMELWWPKVKDGGLLAGHDYINAAWPDVRKAVDEFANRHCRQLRYIDEPWGEWWIHRSIGLVNLRKFFPWPEKKPSITPKEHGWLAPDTHKMLTSQCPPDATVVVECGSWAGLSASVLLDVAPKATLLCVDHWCDPQQTLVPQRFVDAAIPLRPFIYDLFTANRWGSQDRIIPVRRDSLRGLRAIWEYGITPDFVYLDSDHSTEHLLAELRLCQEFWPGVKIGGDDWTQLTVRYAVEEFFTESGRTFDSNGTAFWSMT